LQFLAYYLILLDLQLTNFTRACAISREAPSRFSHFLQPCSLTSYFSLCAITSCSYSCS